MVAFPNIAAALPSILRGEIRCTVLAVDAATIDSALQSIRTLAQATPSHAIVAWCERPALTTRHLLDIAQAGVAELVLRDVDDLRHVLGRILNSAMQRSHALHIEERLASSVPQQMRALFRFSLQHAHQPLDVDRVAAGFGITRQTLRNRLVQHRMPLPRAFITWCRLLVAGSLLDESGHTLDSVGWQLDFSSGHHLGTVMRRYVGRGITEMRETGVSTVVEMAFCAALASNSRGVDRAPSYRDAAASLPEPSAGD